MRYAGAVRYAIIYGMRNVKEFYFAKLMPGCGWLRGSLIPRPIHLMYMCVGVRPYFEPTMTRQPSRLQANNIYHATLTISQYPTACKNGRGREDRYWTREDGKSCDG